MDSALSSRALTKRYGRRTVVRDVTLQVHPGQVYALVGPNGAGKTTLIRLLSGLAFPSEGTVRLLGVDPQVHPEVRRSLGAVVEAPAAFYPWLTGRGNLRLHARLAGGVADGRIDALLAEMELTRDADRRVAVYSLGMRQRLGVAAALLARPRVLLLDEPASGMDPLSLHIVHRALQDAARSGAAVLLSTHHLDEVVRYGDAVGIMEEGALIDQVDLAARRGRYRVVVDDVAGAMAALETASWTTSLTQRGGAVLVQLGESGDAARIAPTLVAAGVAVQALSEDVFDLRGYYRDRLQAERDRRREVAQERVAARATEAASVGDDGAGEEAP